MSDLNIIDQFLSEFTQVIDNGFGLLGPNVHALTTLLIGIDGTLAALFWALGGEQDVLARFVRKILYVGAFALILNRFSDLATIVFNSFENLGFQAGGGAIDQADLLHPGHLAGTGFTAAWPLLDKASKMMGFASFFDNFLTIVVLLFTWIVVILAFFLLAVQLFVIILEFKLTSLAGFVLVPFALWNRSSFLAERVLGNIVSSGVKVMLLGLVTGIGSHFFADFAHSVADQDPDIGQALSLMLASLALFGLGLFTPSIAGGLVSGAPQLGAGAAMNATIGAGGAAMMGGAMMGGAASAGMGAVRAGTALGAGAATAYGLGQETAGAATVGAGLSGVARAAAGAARARAAGSGLAGAAETGRVQAFRAMTGAGAGPGAPGGAAADAMPAWATRLRTEQRARQRTQATAQALGQGDHGGGGATPDIDEKE